jgi:hypothetical protein
VGIVRRMTLPARLASAGMSLLLVASLVGFFTWHTKPKPKPPRATPPPHAATTTTAPPPTTTAPPPPPPPPRVAMSWSNAGAMVWHTHEVDPQWLGQQLRSAGFGWVAVYLGSAGNAEPIDPGWVTRFIEASGLPVGGWTSLAGYPHADAGFAVSQLKRNGLSFYIANAEASYQSKPGASQEFVDRFRTLEPTMTAGLSSLCDAQGIDLQPWAVAGFAFLPQAYVNDFGSAVLPAECVRTASPFSPSQVHPTVGSYHGQKGWVTPQQYSRLLAQAGTTGFSVYLAETNMPATSWQAYGQAIRTLHIATRAS